MKRIGILTAGGDTPALNATILGAVQAANESGIEILGLLNGFASFFEPNAPHVPLNPLFQAIPELDATRGGTILGSSRTSGVVLPAPVDGGRSRFVTSFVHLSEKACTA